MLTIRHEIFNFPFQLWDEKLNHFERFAVDFHRVSTVIDFCHHRVRFGKIRVGRNDAACFAVFHFPVVWMMLQILKGMERIKWIGIIDCVDVAKVLRLQQIETGHNSNTETCRFFQKIHVDWWHWGSDRIFHQVCWCFAGNFQLFWFHSLFRFS